MLTYIKGPFENDPSELVGLSTDEKPMFLGNGSTIYEMDTKRVTMFDKENMKWWDQ